MYCEVCLKGIHCVVHAVDSEGEGVNCCFKCYVEYYEVPENKAITVTLGE